MKEPNVLKATEINQIWSVKTLPLCSVLLEVFAPFLQKEHSSENVLDCVIVFYCEPWIGEGNGLYDKTEHFFKIRVRICIFEDGQMRKDLQRNKDRDYGSSFKRIPVNIQQLTIYLKFFPLDSEKNCIEYPCLNFFFFTVTYFSCLWNFRKKHTDLCQLLGTYLWWWWGCRESPWTI